MNKNTKYVTPTAEPCLIGNEELCALTLSNEAIENTLSIGFGEL